MTPEMLRLIHRLLSLFYDLKAASRGLRPLAARLLRKSAYRSVGGYIRRIR